MSVWIESHKALLTHPKVSSLEELMGWDTDKAIGKLHRFWWWCVDYAEDGSLMKYNDAQIGRAVGLNGDDCKRFVASMKEAGFIDTKPYFRVHDWWQYIGAFLRTRYRKAPHKWKAIQDAYAGDTASETTESTMNVRDSVQDSVPDGVTNQPNQPNQPTEPAGTDLDSEIRIFIGGHPKMLWNPQDHGDMKRIVEKVGWRLAKEWVELGADKGAPPVAYAVGCFRNWAKGNGARDAAKATRAAEVFREDG